MLARGALAAPLTIEEALREAEAASPELRAAAARRARAAEAVPRAWALYKPRLEAQGRYTRNDQEVRFPVPGREIVVQQRDQWDGQATLAQAVVDLRAVAAIKGAGAARALAETEEAQARRDVLFGAAEAFLAAAGLQETAELARLTLDLRRAQEKDVRVKVENGAAPKLSLLRAEIDRLRAEQELEAAAIRLGSARRSLALLLGRGLEEPELAAPPPPESAGPPPLAALVERALRERSEAAGADLAVEQARRARQEARFQLLPTLGLEGLAAASSAAGFRTDRFRWQASLVLSLPLYDSGLTYSAIRETEARFDEAIHVTDSIHRRIADEVSQAHGDLRAALAAYGRAGDELALAKKSAEVAAAAYDAGAATYLELADANQSLASARTVRSAQSLNAQLAALRLRRAAGATDPRAF